MKGFLRVVLVVGMGFLLFGCGQKSGIEGKLLDWNWQPMSGVKIIAEQVPPGHEHFETTTGSDGTFSFKRVSPYSEYTISPWDQNWNTAAKIQAQSGPEGQTILLPSPLVIRFTSNKDGVITDNKTGLQWAPDPDQTMTWDEAIQYAQNLRLGGFSDWRLPTRAELRELGEGGTDPAFKIKGGWGWSSELRASSSDWCSNFSTGQESWLTRDNFYRDKRALVVRFQR
ncbi:MAG: DUF1566 domain-containing protein [Thermodesulfobacteriota bacterium]|jgi:hypothetical protein